MAVTWTQPGGGLVKKIHRMGHLPAVTGFLTRFLDRSLTVPWLPRARQVSWRSRKEQGWGARSKVKFSSSCNGGWHLVESDQ